MLSAKNIWYKLNENYLFENISFDVEKWVVGIYWPSGSGKTTLLKILGGYIEATKWETFLDWKNIWKNIIKYRKNNWFSFQDSSLLELTVKDNLELPFLIWKNKKDEKWINYLIDYFQISNILDKKIQNISWGEKERVSIIKAFIHRPNIVFLDEAGGALDEKLKKKLYDFIKNYSQEKLIFFISHDKDFIKFFNLENILYDWVFKILI